MAISSGGSADHDEPMLDINTTPLIDVMLVMLIMDMEVLVPKVRMDMLNLDRVSRGP